MVFQKLQKVFIRKAGFRQFGLLVICEESLILRDLDVDIREIR
jgi:hypothetical protein